MWAEAASAQVRAAVSGTRGPWGVTAQLLGAQLVLAAVSLIVNVIAARTMGPSGRGSLAVFLQVSYILATCCGAGLNRSYPAAIHGRPVMGTALLDQRRLLFAPLAVVAATILLASLLGPGEGLLPLAYGIALTLTVFGNVLMTTLRTASVAARTARTYLLLVVAGQVVLLLFATAFLLASVDSAAAWLGAYALALTVPSIITWLIVGRRGDPTGSAPAVTQSARRIGLRLLPAALANIAMLRIDRLLLPALAGVSQLGLYVVVAAITELIAWPVQNYVEARVPQWRRALLTGSLPVGRLFGAVGLYAVVAAVAISLLGRWSVIPLFGEAYRQSLDLVVPLAVAAALYAASRLGHALAISAHLSGWVTAIDTVGMISAILAYLILIPPLGASGAAIGCLVGYGACLLVSLGVIPALRRPRIGAH